MTSKTFLIKEFFRVTATGIGGIVVLYGFFSLFLVAPTMIVLQPFITGFNGAVSGYNVVDKTRIFSGLWKGYSVIALFFSGTGTLCLYLFFPHFFITEWINAITFSTISSLFTAFGGLCFGCWVAKKAFRTSPEKEGLSRQNNKDI